MKRLLYISLSLAGFLAICTSCSEWTEVEKKTFATGDGFGEEYYEALRQWKTDTKHDMAWGWFGGWAANGANLKSSLRGLPDSVHLVGIWGSWMPFTITPEKRADLEYVQTVKRTRVVATTITGWVGNDIVSGGYTNYAEKERIFGWKQEWNTLSTWYSTDPDVRPLQEESIRLYARALADSIYKAGYCGIDLDFEPTVGGTSCKLELANRENYHVFVTELAKYLGPASGTDKLLVLDGEIKQLLGKTMPYFDYLIWQSYNYTTDTSMDTYMRDVINIADGHLTPAEVASKFFTTVNFEQYVVTGGGSYTTAGGVSINRLAGQALWQPTFDGQTLRKAGWGSYHIEYEYTLSGKSGFYPWTRSAIQLVHPAQTTIK